MADTRNSLRKKREAYRATFLGSADAPHVPGEAVLDDLRKFCGMDGKKPGLVVSQKAGLTDIHATVYRAALRDVYLRIAGFLYIDEKHLFQQETTSEQTVQQVAES